jgi:hypothetical protein
VLSLARVFGVALAAPDVEAEFGCLLVASGERSERGKLAAGALSVGAPTLGVCSGALHVTLEQLAERAAVAARQGAARVRALG